MSDTWQHYRTDSPKGRAMWGVRPETFENDALLLVRRRDGIPMLHRPECSRVKQAAKGNIIGPVPGALFRAIYRSERAAYLTGEPRYVSFCMFCIASLDDRLAEEVPA